MLKSTQIREMTDDELRQKIDTIRKDLFDLRTQLKSGRAEKPHKIRESRKDIARIMTILRERRK